MLEQLSSSIDERLLDPSNGRPHVVILGAGASRAALLDGDANKRPIPLMKDLVELIELGPLFRRAGIDTRRADFETLYSQLAQSESHHELAKEIQDRVFAYFSGLQLPDAPTLYDHLVLSLRPKDLIATFNWDPFLWDALNRNARNAPVPHTIHLHGNVAVGHCTKHEPISEGRRGKNCRRCGAQLLPSSLLYPIEKDYSNDPAIETAWSQFRLAYSEASALTIFGYSAPTTDRAAMDVLKNLWRIPHPHYAEVEIIDIRNETELYDSWKPLLDGPHFSIKSSFYDSRLSHFPRRTCEVHVAASFDLEFLRPTGIPQNADGVNFSSGSRPSLP